MLCGGGGGLQHRLGAVATYIGDNVLIGLRTESVWRAPATAGVVRRGMFLFFDW